MKLLLKNKGVTLITLMVTVAVVSIVSQLSMWFYPDFLAKNRLNNHINLLYRNINYGRLYAIENNTYVTLCALKKSKCIKDEWQGEVSLFIDKDKSTTLDDDELLLSIFEKVNEADSLEYPRSALTFRPDGSLNGFQNGTFIYCPNSDKANLEGLALSVSQTGRVRIKSTDKCQEE
ncbi:GspH/FimT family pseudopilin [Pseudoalteromonas sp. KG3]|uniref:GspH/FimT family pseudopilin n=1 Tax=Pseudoalteromonas TaxID=53246 RepID=UPI00265981DA|nr:GspH/FimT family pseudopilin [Pseudoalteromonas sp. KG3]WKD23347.1 GspH/FimT family pseudopilin [Pseudoalteromonas sp. KG3]